jgi:phospholipid/cholesterol/gamma-HCH transport system substrate-binding protein
VISRQTKLQLLVFGLIALMGLTFTGAKYAGLGRFFTDQGYTVSADFADSGGIFDGAEVTFRGVSVGKITGLSLRDDGVRVSMQIRPKTKVPNDVKAVVANRSAVGEQFVDLQPRRDGGPFLAEGAVIPRKDTQIPIQPTQLLVNLDRLVNSVNTKDVAIVLDELGKAFDGNTGQSLQRLVDAGNALTEAATVNLPQTIKLIQDSRPVLDTQRDVGPQFKAFNRDLALLTTTLRTSDPDFRALFANGRVSALETTDLIESNRTALPVLLDNLVSTAQVQQVRIPAIRQILVTYPNVVAGGFTVTPGDGTAHFGLVTSQEPGICTKGYKSSPANRGPVGHTDSKPADITAYCALPRGSAENVRGSQNAPYPAGSGPYPNRGGSGGGSAAAAGGSAGSSGSSSGRSSASASSVDPVTLADCSTAGRCITSDGKVLMIGSSAGAARLFGSQSWQWMLLGPLSAP